jgi:hypothetical protein
MEASHKPFAGSGVIMLLFLCIYDVKYAELRDHMASLLRRDLLML